MAPLPSQAERQSELRSFVEPKKGADGILGLVDACCHSPAGCCEEAIVPEGLPRQAAFKKASGRLAAQAARWSNASGACFVAVIRRNSRSSRMGLVLELVGDHSLRIIEVQGGTVQQYNERAMGSAQLEPDDRIVEVNGVSDDNERMLDILGIGMVLEIVVLKRPVMCTVPLC
mmetsp:Transcript_113203/g.316304  ORF Transcript_113203/g.316304 Transcript_113203/m.316304 type:complete len:173 (-) Transcript_113203:188-706(-)